ncbi:MAG: hypothetical protein MMC33_007966 [Icmadophila ericetorum]|nr:hypothetical protein [Icmadophila ericetorum]
MKSIQDNYRLLDQESEGGLSRDYEDSTAPRNQSRKTITFLLFALVASVSINVFQTSMSMQQTLTSLSKTEPVKSRFAGLAWDTPRAYTIEDGYDDMNETVRSEYWDAINYDSGSLALSYEYTARMGLPKAQPFPWDESKGLYFLSAHHSIHCAKIVHQTLTELYDGVPNSYPMGHAFHCIDVLRQDAVCLADDTPLFTSFEHPGSPGRNQGRLCRDWSKLEKFAWDHTSCWRDISPTKHIETNLLRYRYCPAGSQYNEKILEEFPGFDIEGNVRIFGS